MPKCNYFVDIPRDVLTKVFSPFLRVKDFRYMDLAMRMAMIYWIEIRTGGMYIGSDQSDYQRWLTTTDGDHILHGLRQQVIRQAHRFCVEGMTLHYFQVDFIAPNILFIRDENKGERPCQTVSQSPFTQESNDCVSMTVAKSMLPRPMTLLMRETS